MSESKIKLEVGKRYVLRDGRTTEPLSMVTDSEFPFSGCMPNQGYPYSWTASGFFMYSQIPDPVDIVAEYEDKTPDPVDIVAEYEDKTPELKTIQQLSEEIAELRDQVTKIKTLLHEASL